MGASRLAVSTLFFLSLTLSRSRAATSSVIQWKKPGESMKISCSSTSEQNHLYLKFCCDKFTVVQWNLHETFTIKDGWGPRVKTVKTGPRDLLITIANLTAQDTGLYQCEYMAIKSGQTQMMDAGAVLVVVQAADADTDAAADADADETFPVIVVVLCIVILLLLGVLVSMWILRKMKHMHINAVRPLNRANPSDVYEDMRSTCRRGAPSAPSLWSSLE